VFHQLRYQMAYPHYRQARRIVVSEFALAVAVGLGYQLSGHHVTHSIALKPLRDLQEDELVHEVQVLA
jgi:hypothetical protein